MSMGNKRVPGKHPFKITAHNIVDIIAIATPAPKRLNYLDMII